MESHILPQTTATASEAVDRGRSGEPSPTAWRAKIRKTPPLELATPACVFPPRGRKLNFGWRKSRPTLLHDPTRRPTPLELAALTMP